eukprot:gene218-46_t
MDDGPPMDMLWDDPDAGMDPSEMERRLIESAEAWSSDDGPAPPGAGSSAASSSGGAPPGAPGDADGRPSKRSKVVVDVSKDRTNVVDPNKIDYKQWLRKPVPRDYLTRPLGPENEMRSLTFMQVELDDYPAAPHPDFCTAQQKENSEAPVLRIYGITAEGHSVVAHIHGFTPYFYCPVANCDDAVKFQDSLEAALKDSRQGAQLKRQVLKVEIVKRSTIWEWNERGDQEFFRVHLAKHRLIGAARDIIAGSGGPGSGKVAGGFMNLVGGGLYQTCQTYETNVPFALRFMIDQGLQGASWCSLGINQFTARDPQKCVGTCQIELDAHFQHLVPAADQSSIAPLRILSFDIECWNQFGKGFPEAKINPVIQIAAEVKEVGSKDKNYTQVVWTLDSCGDIGDTEVMSFEDEREMLNSFSEFIRTIDADFLTGYNIINFDIPYLLERAATLEIQQPFCELGRLLKHQCRIREWTTPGGQQQKEIQMAGRIIFDMYTVIRKEHGLRSYTLNFVSSNFLGDQKEDVHYSVIGTLHTGNAETRRRLAVYCLKDAKLPLRLMDKLCCLYNYVEMARVTGTPINFLLNRGQSIKVFCQILRKAKASNYIVPARKIEENSGQFEGATVLEPKTDFYNKPIATLDFASLYPSIMMAHNLCYCTLIPPHRIRGGEVEGLSAEDYTVTPCNNYFVKPSKRRGLLPRILEELLTARKKAKKEMAQEQDGFKKAVLNGRQLALKISANSVYGFTGAQVGMMPCLEISSSVTAFGRTMIEHTKAMVEEKYQKANGY